MFILFYSCFILLKFIMDSSTSSCSDTRSSRSSSLSRSSDSDSDSVTSEVGGYAFQPVISRPVVLVGDRLHMEGIDTMPDVGWFFDRVVRVGDHSW